MKKGTPGAQQRAARLAAIRVRLHKIKSQRQFAAHLGVTYQTYNNWERGEPIPVNEAKRIKDATPGLTGDYILWGDESGLTVQVLKALRSDKPDK
jgi:DNA-binding XRE family transcriptional regulator